MKNLVLVFGLLVFACAMSPALLAAAERDQSGAALGRALKSRAAESGSLGAMPSAKNNPCAEFGAGFVRVEGSSTCIRAGGYVRAGAGIQR